MNTVLFSTRNVKLPAEVIADLNEHGDAFRKPRPGGRRLVSRGAEFPGIAGAQNRNDNPVRAVGVDFQLGSRHRNQFGFGLDGLAHDGRSRSCLNRAGWRFEQPLSRG
jgi:hypothetical protein